MGSGYLMDLALLRPSPIALTRQCPSLLREGGDLNVHWINLAASSFSHSLLGPTTCREKPSGTNWVDFGRGGVDWAERHGLLRRDREGVRRMFGRRGFWSSTLSLNVIPEEAAVHYHGPSSLPSPPITAGTQSKSGL